MVATAFAQETENEKQFGVKLSGFVKNDFIFDTRQTVAAREGHLLLWPAPYMPDNDGADINEGLNFNFLSIQTRLKGSITGPDAFGARTSGVIEGSFFGTTNSDINGFRLRHAFAKLKWENSEILFGQTWHPMFNTASFPGTVSFNTGLPFQPFSRNPQLRLTRNMGDLSLVVTFLSQRDFFCADGGETLRNSGLPESHIQMVYHQKNDEHMEILAGIGWGYKQIRPRLVTPLNYVENARVPSSTSQAFVKLKIKPLTIKLQGIMGENTYDIMGISSYGVTSIDPSTGLQEYTATGSAGGWMEIHSNGEKFQAGIFAGYIKNQGANQTIIPGSVSGSRSNIEYVSRIAPRLIYNAGKVRIALEFEVTTAAFGTIQADATVENSTAVTNYRTLLGAYYFF